MSRPLCAHHASGAGGNAPTQALLTLLPRTAGGPLPLLERERLARRQGPQPEKPDSHTPSAQHASCDTTHCQLWRRTACGSAARRLNGTYAKCQQAPMCSAALQTVAWPFPLQVPMAVPAACAQARSPKRAGGDAGCPHLQEAVVAQEQRRAVDAQVEHAVVAAGDADAHGRRDQLHPLAPLHFEHAPHRADHHLPAARRGSTNIYTATSCTR